MVRVAPARPQLLSTTHQALASDLRPHEGRRGVSRVSNSTVVELVRVLDTLDLMEPPRGSWPRFLTTTSASLRLGRPHRRPGYIPGFRYHGGTVKFLLNRGGFTPSPALLNRNFENLAVRTLEEGT